MRLTKLTARWIQGSVKSSGSSAIDFTSAQISSSIYSLISSFLFSTFFWIYLLFPFLIVSNSKLSICYQTQFGLPSLPYFYFSTWILVHDLRQEVLLFGWVFFPSCSGNTSRLLRVPEQRRTDKNCCTQHIKCCTQPAALPSPRATRRRPTSKKNSVDSSFISLLSIKLH